VGRYIRSEHDPECAEVGFAILDGHQGKGIGSVLLQHLAIIGRNAGIKEFDADVLVSNYQMSEVLEHSGFKLKRTDNLGVSRQRLVIA
jgi:GNAT superfamily N-acetyltransferase